MFEAIIFICKALLAIAIPPINQSKPPTALTKPPTSFAFFHPSKQAKTLPP
jgi:hypothetical protein